MTNKKLLFTARQNPHLNIFILFVSLNGSRNEIPFQPSKALKIVLSFSNVNVNFLDLHEFAKNSPLETFIESGKLQSAKFVVSHTSDVLRLLVLWKYGGHYLDSDVIVKKNLDSLPSNSACDDTYETVNGAVLNLDHSKIGRSWSEKFMTELLKSYNGSDWGNNGPLLITRVLRKSCGTNKTAEMIEKGDCEGFHVLPNNFCYPITGLLWEKFFKEEFREKALKAVKNSVVVHFWNNLSKKTPLRVDSKAAYITLAKQFCPKVMAGCEDFF